MEDQRKDMLEQKEMEDRPKKPYTAPQLTVHGDVEQITQAIGPGPRDGIVGSLPG
jgi:hypothetical protein